MQFENLKINDVIKIVPRSFGDDRGVFMETFKSSAFNEAVGHDVVFVQDNQSVSVSKYTLRGLHYQSPPHAQGKLVRCIQGSILDVAVDVRKNSSTYGQHVTQLLSAENNAQLWVPEGFLHGFLTLEENSIVQYKCTDYYAPQCDGNVFWNDPDLRIDWGIDQNEAVLSDKDSIAPKFKDFSTPF
ncbi:dTDP-4-dehydrorhamnose 3,5-epimerase [Hellea sp.]|nr:dTDP-4-dehydrorhamnose 3,5-epimerase [Hellea sp.]